MGRGYRKVKDQRTGKKRRTHRVVAEQLLGRPLLPTEVVHHRDGDGQNNAPENLVVLSSQRQHASIEYHLRQSQRGMVPLFPELLIGDVNEVQEGTLFAHVFLAGPQGLSPSPAPAKPKRKTK